MLEIPNDFNDGRICFNTTEIEYMLVGDAVDAFAAGGEPLRADPVRPFPNTIELSNMMDFQTLQYDDRQHDSARVDSVSHRVGLIQRLSVRRMTSTAHSSARQASTSCA